MYVAYFIEAPAQFARGAETFEKQEAYAEYISNIPAWAIAVGIIAAVARLMGAVALFFRRSWALPLYQISLLFFVVALFRAFVVANVASVMSGGHIAIETVFLALSVFAVWFAHRYKQSGLLK